MLEWFQEGLPTENVEVIDISTLKIARCLHCYKCWTDHPNQCVIDDDAKIFKEKIHEADLIVFFIPLSYSSMPSDMKRAMERLFPETTPFFYHNHRPTSRHTRYRKTKIAGLFTVSGLGIPRNAPWTNLRRKL